MPLVMFWALKMIVQMEFAMKGKFQTVALDFRIISQVFFFFPENANVPKRPKWDSDCTNDQCC